MLKPKSLALTPPGQRGISQAQGGIRNSSSPARQNKGQVLNTSQFGEKKIAPDENFMGSNPPGKV